MCLKSLCTIGIRMSHGGTLYLKNDALGSLTQCLLNMTTRGYCDSTCVKPSERRTPRLLPRMISRKSYAKRFKEWFHSNRETKPTVTFFNEKNPRPETTNVMTKLQNLDMEQVSRRWKCERDMQEIENQKYLQHRTEALGADIAAMHFFTYRNAAVRLKDSDEWIAGTLTMLTRVLPHCFEEGYCVEAIDCSNFHHSGIRYEGLENLTGLNNLKWLSLKNQKHIDTWCLDRIAGQNGQSLEYLDISSCKLDTGGVVALTRMPNLKTLIIRDPGDDEETQAALAYLDFKLPTCIIKAVNDDNELVCASEEKEI